MNLITNLLIQGLKHQPTVLLQFISHLTQSQKRLLHNFYLAETSSFSFHSRKNRRIPKQGKMLLNTTKKKKMESNVSLSTQKPKRSLLTMEPCRSRKETHSTKMNGTIQNCHQLTIISKLKIGMDWLFKGLMGKFVVAHQ